MDKTTIELLNYLGRGGSWQYYWQDPMLPTTWFRVGEIPDTPDWKRVYFPVHPGARAIFGSKRGGIGNVEAVNCLFADFDGDKVEILKRVNQLPTKPSVLVDSGGGIHAYWLLTDTVQTRAKGLRDVMIQLQARWVAFVGADEGAKDLARVLRLPGTMNHKYDPPRPVIFVEADFTRTFTLEELAALLPAVPSRETRTPAPAKQATGQGSSYGRAALREEVNRVRTAPEHTRNITLNKAAFAVGQLVGGGELPRDAAREALINAGLAAGLEPYETDKTVNSGLDDGQLEPRTTPQEKKQRDKPMATQPPPDSIILEEVQKLADVKITDITPPPRKMIFTAAELLATDFPDPNWIIPGIVPEGLAILGGRPKVGKSWLALQMGISVGSGGRFFDKQIDPGEVLFVALEDNPRRLKKRLLDMGVTEAPPITFVFEYRPLHQGGIDDLYAAIMSNRYRLITVDPLNRAFIGIDQNDSPMIPRLLSQLQTATMQQNSTLLFTDHTRKPVALTPDPIDDIIAQTGKTSIADVILALYRTQGKVGANLKGRGREIEEIDVVIQQDPVTHAWQLVGEAGEVALSEIKNSILALLDDTRRMTLAEICKGLGKTTAERGNVYKYMADLVNRGNVIKQPADSRGRVYYELHIPV